MAGRVPAAGTSGISASPQAQVSRRTANMAVAVVATASPWRSDSVQCWVERLVRTGRASISNGPSAIGPAKLTVSETGSPRRCGWSSAACSSVAAVMPPNGPIMFQYAGVVRPRKRCSPAGSSASASSKGWSGLAAVAAWVWGAVDMAGVGW